LREICVRTDLLQLAHNTHFKNKLTGKNTKNLNFWLFYCIKTYDNKRGTNLLSEWKYYIKLSSQKLDEYNSTLKEQIIILRAYYPVWWDKVNLIGEKVDWDYLIIHEADIYVPKRLKYI
jgi:hypothetical protein